MYTNAQYATGNTGINVEINGIPAFVPLDPNNTDYAAIMALVAEGKLTIGAAQ